MRRIEAVEGRFDHAPPAYALTGHKDEFFASVNPKTVQAFEELMKLLNATIPKDE